MERQSEHTLKERLDCYTQESAGLVTSVACVSEPGLAKSLPVCGDDAVVVGAEKVLYIVLLGTAILESNTDDGQRANNGNQECEP